jgi:hypothetical protein
VPATTAAPDDVSVTLTDTLPTVRFDTENRLKPGTRVWEPRVVDPEEMLTEYVVMPDATRTTT